MTIMYANDTIASAPISRGDESALLTLDKNHTIQGSNCANIKSIDVHITDYQYNR